MITTWLAIGESIRINQGLPPFTEEEKDLLEKEAGEAFCLMFKDELDRADEEEKQRELQKTSKKENKLINKIKEL